MKKLLFTLLLLPFSAFSAPSVISNPLVNGVAQCGVFLDALPEQMIAVTAVTLPAPGNICKFDVSTVAAGAHTISFTAITVNDPVWGSQESAKSSPLSFTRPSAPSVPAGLQLTP